MYEGVSNIEDNEVFLFVLVFRNGDKHGIQVVVEGISWDDEMIASHLWPLSGIHTLMLPQRIPTLLKASIRVCVLIRFSAILLYLKNSLDQTGFETTVHVTSNISESIEIRGNPLQITVSCLCLVYRMSVSSLAMWVQLHLKFNPTLLEVWPNFTQKFNSTSLELWVCSKMVLPSRLLWG